MKARIITLWLCVCTAVALAQEYEPNTRWPYLYEQFTGGSVFFPEGRKDSLQLNIHLMGNVLHYVHKNGKIYQNSDKDIRRVEIGGDVYLPVDGKWMQLMAHREGGELLKLVRADFDVLFTGTGAYGASLNSSATRDLSSLDLGGLNTPELGKMLQERREGKTLPLVNEYFFRIGDQFYPATRKDVEAHLPAARAAEWKSFQKTAKVKWKREESLAGVLEFLLQE